MTVLVRRALLLIAMALPLLLGPLRAQETTQEPQPAGDKAPEKASEPPAPPAEADGAAPPAGDENVSADNSLSFPVDI